MKTKEICDTILNAIKSFEEFTGLTPTEIRWNKITHMEVVKAFYEEDEHFREWCYKMPHPDVHAIEGLKIVVDQDVPKEQALLVCTEKIELPYGD